MTPKLELRCDRHLHMLFDPRSVTVSVKCHWCSQWKKRPVFHAWPLTTIIERYGAGDLTGVCAPQTPEQFVHWRVKSVA